jgi:DNA polymerase
VADAAGGINLQNLPTHSEGLGQHIRGLLIPHDEHKFVVADASQIEARILAWMAGQDDLVHIFAEGKDVYSQFASQLFGEPVRKPSPEDPAKVQALLKSRRQLGKVSILGLGYSMGEDRFTQTVRHDPVLAEMLTNGSLSEQFLVGVVRTYRETYAKIPALWRATEQAFRCAVTNGRGPIGAVEYRRTGDDIYAWLPSSRYIVYPDVDVNLAGQISCNNGNKLYGGKLVENLVQAMARDALVEVLLRLEAQGYPVVLTVHDEVVLEVPQDRAQDALAAALKEMATPPVWAPGLPLAAGGAICDRYGKG